MGSSNWSDDFYKDRAADRVARNVPTFAYNADVKAGKVAAKAHDKLSPYGVTRESRDSEAHPESVAIGVIFDETGSMREIPVQLQKKLPQLMALLLRKNYVKDPQILFGAVGDFFSDKASLQVGQFESGVEMDDDITKIYLEGNGGGQNTESYQNVFYFFARHTSIDCFEKRGKKGYLFVIGDEHPFKVSTKREIKTIFGDDVQADITTEELIREAQAKYNVFFIIPEGASHGKDPYLKSHWGELVGPEHVIMLDNPDAVCEAIGTAIGLIEGTTTGDAIAADLTGLGVSGSIVNTIANALDPLAKKTALTRVGTGNLPEKKDAGTVVRL